MFKFLDFIKNYIQAEFQSDSEISNAKKPDVYTAYRKSHEPASSKPEIQVQIMDNSERTNFTTFCKKNANTIPMQITAYTGQLSINKTQRSAQEASIIFGDKIEKLMYDLIYGNINKNILGGRLITTSPALPMNDGGTIYMTALRFEFIVASPYVED